VAYTPWRPTIRIAPFVGYAKSETCYSLDPYIGNNTTYL